MIRTRSGVMIVGAALVAASALVAPAPASAQSVTVAPVIEAGASWTYDLGLDLLIAQEVEGQEISGRVVQSARMRFDVSGVDADAGTAAVSGQIDRLSLMWRRGEQQYEWSWRRADGEPPAMDEVEAGGAEGEFQRMAAALANADIGLTVAMGSGEVTSVTGLNEASGAISINSGVDRSALGLFNPGQFADAVEAIWSADGAAGMTVSPDTGWQTDRLVPLGPAGQFIVITDWRATAIQDEALQYEGSVIVEVAPPAQRAEDAPRVRLLQQSGSVEGAWAIEDRILRRRTSIQSLSAEWTLAGLAATQTQRAETTLERVEQ